MAVQIARETIFIKKIFIKTELHQLRHLGPTCGQKQNHTSVLLKLAVLTSQSRGVSFKLQISNLLRSIREKKMLPYILVMLPLQATSGNGCGRGTVYDEESASCIAKCGTGTVRGN